MIDALARSPLVLALGAALVASLWQLAVCALAAWVLLRQIPVSRGRLRYGLSVIALLASAAWPVITFVRAWQDAARDGQSLSGSASIAGLGASEAWGGLAWVEPQPPSLSARVFAVLSCLWIAGLLFAVARLLVGWRGARRLVAESSPDIDPRWREAFSRLARQLRVRGARLLVSAKIDVPMAIGVLRPAVIVPVAVLTELPPSAVEALLAHELAHLARLDFAVNLVLSAVEILFFYHPGMRFLARAVRAEREHATDDLAAPLVGERQYARALFALASLRVVPPEPAVPSNGGSLMLRIQRLIVPNPSPEQGGSRLGPALVAVAALGISAIGLGSCGTTPEVESSAPGEEALSEVKIAWLPPVLAPYRPIFEEASHKHGVDADVLAIVALVESSGNPSAVSPAGAVGLMQVMPKTALSIAAERGLTDVREDRLSDPATNVDLGAWYLARQMETFGAGAQEDKKVELAAAAYNAGPRAVEAYLKNNVPLPEETEHYKALVTGLWAERNAPESRTFVDWRSRVRARMASKAARPVAGGEVTLSFGETFEGKKHEGVDIALREGAPVSAPLRGTVVSAREEGDRGNVVVIRHSGGLETRYHHLATIAVKEGDSVDARATIGTVGNTGKSTGPHVHFEVRDLGAPIDPTAYLSDKP